MAIVNNAGADQVAFVGEFIDRATYVGDEKVFPKGTNISVIRGSSNPTQNGVVCGEFVETAGMVYLPRRTTSNNIGVYDVARAKLVGTLATPPSAGINGIAFKPDGSKGWISGDNPGGVYLFDPTLGVGEKISTTAANAVIFPPGGSEVYASHRNSRFIRTYAEDSNLQVGADISTPNGADKLATNVGGSQVYAMSVAGKCVYVVDTATKTVLGAPITDTTKGIGSGLAGGSGNRCYTCKDSTVYSINTDTGTVEHQYESPGVVFSALRYVHETSRLYALSSLGKVIHCFDTSGAVPTFIDSIELRIPTIKDLAPYAGGDWAVTIHDNNIVDSYVSFEVLYLGPPPDSTAVTAISPEPWQPATDWVNEDHLPEQPLPDPDPIVDEL